MIKSNSKKTSKNNNNNNNNNTSEEINADSSQSAINKLQLDYLNENNNKNNNNIYSLNPLNSNSMDTDDFCSTFSNFSYSNNFQNDLVNTKDIEFLAHDLLNETNKYDDFDLTESESSSLLQPSFLIHVSSFQPSACLVLPAFSLQACTPWHPRLHSQANPDWMQTPPERASCRTAPCSATQALRRHCFPEAVWLHCTCMAGPSS